VRFNLLSSRSSPARRPRRAGALLLAVPLLLTAACGAERPSAASTSADGTSADGDLVPLTIAEPVHGVGYLPLYVGMHEGFFEEEGLDVSTVTLQGGGAHTNAVLTGEAWGFIGGPEHNAFAAARGGDAVTIKAIANIVNRGNNYLVAAPGLTYDGDLAEFLEGKTVVTGAYGGTPNSIIRYLLDETGLEEGADVRLVESADATAALAIVKQGQAEVAVVSEPILGRGVDEGIWEEPFYSVPDELGPYAYSTLNIRQESIDDDPGTVQAFARALLKSLALTEAEPEKAYEVARVEFPTLEPDVLQATLDRSYDDDLWEWSGEVTPTSLETALDVARASGVLEDGGDPVQYDDIVDMSFVDAASTSGG